MHKFFLLTALVAVLQTSTCQTAEPAQNQLTHYFQISPAIDTLIVEISESDEITYTWDSIPNKVFFNLMPSELWRDIDHIADPESSVVVAVKAFPINKHITGYLVGFQQHWFQNFSLFLFQNKRKKFSNRITLAEWYGGEGGQVLIGSWLFDYNGDGQPDILRHNIQHSLRPTETDFTEQTTHTVELLRCKTTQFKSKPLADQATAIRRFPIRHYWE